MDPRTWRQAIEAQLNDLFDRATALITALDLMEADSKDLEDGADHEPYLVGWSGYNDDREATTATTKTTARQNRALALNRVCQLHWAVGSRSDREKDAGDMAEVPAYGD
ncbi:MULTISPECIES: hypothetical protein [Mesorhizobium]|uniref:Uncharacterized protein n=1 Tax=Mesorhizobium shonense TaxID=1209948 RepID=A0ABV2HVU6_9HYPH|nr:hypothetical protein [Mesorhizobium sp.]RWD97939.1 MAG: hypothetical protein EOS40_26295 [Mesorhizobium sp.]TIS46176.1 MAG: hypothetical protein E5W96_27745 [Mesorhizobium sp.]